MKALMPIILGFALVSAVEAASPAWADTPPLLQRQRASARSSGNSIFG